LDSKGSLQNDLFCGEKDMDSTKPTKELIDLSIKVKENNNLYNYFLENKDERILKEIYQNKDFSWFKNSFEEYLDKYGYRCMNELKLSEKSLKDNPKFLITVIKNYFNIKNLNLEDLNYTEYLKRKKAEDIVLKKLRFRPFRKTLFFWALKNARKSIKYRENLRLCRTKIFGIVRESFLAIAKDFQSKKIIDEIDDIFYLQTDEIFDFINGIETQSNLRTYISTRKKEYKKFEKINLPERFETKTVFERYRLVEILEKITDSVINKNGILTGVSCCPGIVKNKVKVILSPDDNVKLNGEILVAEKTDPGWVPLYPSISGLLIERGSVLSHSAIVARELGLPTIVGIKDLIKNIKDGQIIKMDAGKGIIYLNEKKDE